MSPRERPPPPPSADDDAHARLMRQPETRQGAPQSFAADRRRRRRRQRGRGRQRSAGWCYKIFSSAASASDAPRPAMFARLSLTPPRRRGHQRRAARARGARGHGARALSRVHEGAWTRARAGKKRRRARLPSFFARATDVDKRTCALSRRWRHFLLHDTLRSTFSMR